MTHEQIGRLGSMALHVREHIISMATDGGCFIGASLSCADLLVYLYTQVLDVSPSSLADPSRDYLLLSKGHDVPALYGTLVECGFLDREVISEHLVPGRHVYWHPNRNIPGVEFHSGSLGHLLAVGIGIATDMRLRSGSNRVFVLSGDGELNEGSMWEAILVAASQKLDNLVLVVDRNAYQANVPTETLNPLEPLEAKFQAFGWQAIRIDGHSFPEMEQAFTRIPARPGHPTAIIANTVRGKGLPSIECRADRWFANFTRQEVDDLLLELHGRSSAILASAPLIVR